MLWDIGIDSYAISFQSLGTTEKFANDVRGTASLVLADPPYNIGLSKTSRNFINIGDVKLLKLIIASRHVLTMGT
jgi:16S rRNA G966 N2-methylase RsmD